MNYKILACWICGKPVDLRSLQKWRRIIKSNHPYTTFRRPNRAVSCATLMVPEATTTNRELLIESLKDVLKAANEVELRFCPDCNLPMERMVAMFYFDDEVVETLLPYCPRCSPSKGLA